MLLLTALVFSSCSPITAYTQRDLVRVQEMADTHGYPGVKACAEHLATVVGQKQEILSEDVDGLLSLAFKAYLLRQGSEDAEANFLNYCSEVAAGLMLEAAKALRR
mgnify:CR=1 FL=1